MLIPIMFLVAVFSLWMKYSPPIFVFVFLLFFKVKFKNIYIFHAICLHPHSVFFHISLFLGIFHTVMLLLICLIYLPQWLGKVGSMS